MFKSGYILIPIRKKDLKIRGLIVDGLDQNKFESLADSYGIDMSEKDPIVRNIRVSRDRFRQNAGEICKIKKDGSVEKLKQITKSTNLNNLDDLKNLALERGIKSFYGILSLGGDNAGEWTKCVANDYNILDFITNHGNDGIDIPFIYEFENNTMTFIIERNIPLIENRFHRFRSLFVTDVNILKELLSDLFIKSFQLAIDLNRENTRPIRMKAYHSEKNDDRHRITDIGHYMNIMI